MVAALAAFAAGLTVLGVVFATWETFWGDGRPAFQGNEDVGNYLWVRSLIVDGDLELESDLAATPALPEGAKENWTKTIRTDDGRLANPQPPGWSLVTLPAFVVGHALAVIAGAEADGWSPLYSAVLWGFHLAVGAAGLWAAWQVVSRYARREVAAAAVLAMWVASPLVYYQTARIGVVHGLVFALTAFTCHLTLRVRDEPSRVWRWPALGLVIGLLVVTRAAAAVYLLFPLFVLWDVVQQSPRRLVPRSGPRWGGGVLAGVLLVGLIINGGVNGLTWAGAVQTGLHDWAQPRFWAVLFSPMHGLFYWHPLVFVGVAGLLWGAFRGELPWTWVFAFALIYQVNAAWQWSWVGSAFGARGFDGAILFAMAGLAWLLNRLPRVFLFRAALWCGVGCGALLFVLFLLGAIPRDQPVTYAEMIAAVFALVLD